MKNIVANIPIPINDKLFLADPTNSALGKKILYQSISMIADLGFEKFTFKKLGDQIASPEASIYRYFKNKNQLLIYIISWYWGWMEYRLVFETANIIDPKKRLEKAIASLTLLYDDTNEIAGIDMKQLIPIIIVESTKSYLSKEVDQANEIGAYTNYKNTVERVAKIILEINPHFKYPMMLITTIIEGAHLQQFYSEHLPRLTNKQKSKNYITQFYTNLVFKTITK
jgi:AcrR family transcriptional regulator